MEVTEVRDINAIMIGERYRKDLGDIQGLAQSIKEVGLLHPVVIAPDGLLIAGHRRLEACKALGWLKIPVTVIDIKDINRGQADENAARKDLTPSEAVAIAKVLEPEVKKATAERHGAQAEVKPELVEGKLPTPGAGKTRDKLAKFVGMSGRTLEKATQVVSAAQQDPEKYSHLVEKMDRKGKVDGAFRELRRLQIQNSSTETAATSLTKELFSVIFAVPPWTEAHQGDGVGGHKEQVQVLSLKEMKKLKPPIAGDAVMFVQTPASSLGSALELLAAWGFKYETFLVLTHFATGVSPWLKENHRAVLVGVQGGHRPPLPENLAPSLILQTTPVPEAAIRRCIERMFPGEKYLAVFSKIDYQGWSSWPGRAETAEKLEKATSGNPATGLT